MRKVAEQQTYRNRPIATVIETLSRACDAGFTHARIVITRYVEVPPKSKTKPEPNYPGGGQPGRIRANGEPGKVRTF